MGLKSKDLLGMKQLTADEIMEIFDKNKAFIRACIEVYGICFSKHLNFGKFGK